METKELGFETICKLFPILQPAPYEGDVLKHQEHDQKTHGSWATGISSELENWNPKDPIPASPRNAGGATERFWDNWEHGVDGDQFVDLYRQYAGEMLGLPVPKSEKDVGGSENYLTQRGFGASSTSAVRNQTEAVLNAIANGKPQPTLYRGMAANNPESQELLNQFTSLEQGDTIDMPLVSTTRSLGVAQWYAVDRSYAPNDNKVIVKIQEGAKGISVKPEKSWYPSDHETIVSGKFEVVGKTEVTVPHWSRSAVIGTAFKDRDEQTVYRISDPNDPSWGGKSDSESASRFKSLVNGINSGDFSEIETSTLKYTNDRNPSGVKEDASRIAVNAWTRKETKTFTVIEVKLVEPHVVKKAFDKGLTFDKLFSTVPFIRDVEVEKHGTHDQKTHGNWATGNFDEEAQGEDAQSTYFDKYGVTTGATKEPVGISRDEIDSLNSYTEDGYKRINGLLRGNLPDTFSQDEANMRELAKEKIADLDKLIEESPDLFGDKNLYRVFTTDTLDALKEGDSFTDKAFLSTTRVDITNPDNVEILQNLQLLTNEVNTQAAVILPSASKSGKGLAIDFIKNALSDFTTNTSTANSEKEVLLPRGTSLKFIGYKKINAMTDNVMDVAIFERVDK